MAKECKTNPVTMTRIIHDDLGMSSFNLQRKQSLTKIQILKRFERSTDLLREMKRGMTDEIVWSDETCYIHC